MVFGYMHLKCFEFFVPRCVFLGVVQLHYLADISEILQLIFKYCMNMTSQYAGFMDMTYYMRNYRSLY